MDLIFYTTTKQGADTLLDRDFALEQPELYIEFLDSDIREFAMEHKHPILTQKSLIFA